MIVNNETFKTKIEDFHPLSPSRTVFWREEKRRCIEGYWVAGKWMPGPLYFYINHWTIELSENAYSKAKVLGSPLLRDIEWEKAYVHAEARGFSGFEDDTEVSCHRILLDPDPEASIRIILASSMDDKTREHLRKSWYKPDGTLKAYVSTRDYLRRVHKYSLGRPYYFNEAKNVIDIESRGTGKSFIGSVFLGHNFLFDGVTWYEQLKSETPPKSETLIGAIDSFYSNGIIKKLKLGLENLKGGLKYNGVYYPSPLAKSYTGSWGSGDTITSEADVKEGGSWLKKGTYSLIHHRSFKDKPIAANGTRPGFSVIEEIGFMDNLEDSLGQLAECTMNGAVKFGTLWMTGTGGDMAGGATEQAKKVFYDPEQYDCLSFEDTYEHRPKRIGFFVPAYMGLNQFKDQEGNTNIEAAKDYLLKVRQVKAQATSKQPLNDELQQRPMKPSEAFLVSTGNIFPVADLKEHLNWVQSQESAAITGIIGTVIIDSEGKPKFLPDLIGAVKPCGFPVEAKADNRGAVVMWEPPDSEASYGWYIAGCDPYNKDSSNSSKSLGSLILVKRAGLGKSPYDKIVLEYTGRPDRADEFYENCRKILLLYNGAICLYENNFNGLKVHLEYKNQLHLLAKSPNSIKAMKSQNEANTYGLHMHGVVKDELEIYLRDWLTTSAGDGKMNLHHIYSVPLLEELIAYNEEDNFDRVIALMLAVAQGIQMRKIAVEAKKELIIDPFFTRKHFIKR